MADELPVDSVSTSCVIVGGGPGGVMLALLLARKGVPVVLLESHPDFDRDFRGDTVHPSTLDALDAVGLADGLHQLPHGKGRVMRAHTPAGTVTVASYERVRAKFPYTMILAQSKFLDYLAGHLKGYTNAAVVMSANVQRLVEEGGHVRGVRYRGMDGNWHEVRAALTVAADGRFSKLRQLAGLAMTKTSPPMDVLWFRLPRADGDPAESVDFYFGPGHMAVMIDRADHWQVGWVFPKGGYTRLKAAGLGELHRELRALVPFVGDRAEAVKSWADCAVLSVESGRAPRWHRPGFLMIGDAAHVMSPVAGVGINYAVQDAIEAANRLAGPLLAGALTERHLAGVQRRRELSVKVIQAVQRAIQSRVVSAALDPSAPFRLPLPMRVMARFPRLQGLPARLVGWGVRRSVVR